ncbi:hypothetical protein CPB83DRAFT_768654 [Crepidotus variabilis]|uniref:Uncharacterized protein n=1 Tax=Crepidotus variabilis TaxID=179855 RepID=A0A9P6EE89_9AGAR|nr:hypothetical protein CPB83DRAFT_768654 [Crepidotus variabilis]
MPSSISPETKTQKYSQQLAAYTLRQFNVAFTSLDTKKTASLSKIPSVYSRVSRAEQLLAKGRFLVLHPHRSKADIGQMPLELEYNLDRIDLTFVAIFLYL